MAKVVLICGKICAGKSTYAKKLAMEQHMVWLSCDDIMLSLFGDNVNELYEEYHDKVEKFLLKQATNILLSGISVILDFGFWGRSERTQITNDFRVKNIDCEWHYIDVSDSTLYKNIEKRNADIINNGCNEYYTDDELISKCLHFFEVPEREEMDVWVDNNEY